MENGQVSMAIDPFRNCKRLPRNAVVVLIRSSAFLREYTAEREQRTAKSDFDFRNRHLVRPAWMRYAGTS
jgi:hypothetical protein